MNGTKYFIDTNAIIAFLKGNVVLEKHLATAAWIGTSSIVIIEFLSFPGLLPEDRQTFEKFISRIQVQGLPTDISTLQSIADLRIQHKLKLPDAIIAAQSIQNEARLISNDKQLKAFTDFSF